MGLVRYDSVREANASEKRRREWKCIRHLNPDDVLSIENRAVSTEFTNEQSDIGRFWNGRNGFIHGPGFKAFAEDFPPGTKIIVNVQVTLP